MNASWKEAVCSDDGPYSVLLALGRPVEPRGGHASEEDQVHKEEPSSKKAE